MSVEKRGNQWSGEQWLRLLFWIYLAVLLRITVFRDDFSLTGLMENGRVNLELFTTYARYLRGGFYWLFTYLFVGNIIWFVPLGAYLYWRYPGLRVWRITLVGCALSLMIEGAQYVFGTGVTDVDDLVLNTAGTWIGAVFVWILQKVMEKRTGKKTEK